MKIALIGATGFIGQYILAEALARKHQVKALVRNPSKISASEGLSAEALDISDAAQVTQMVRGHEAVIMAVRHNGLDFHAFLEAIKASGVPRLLVVGGAGSLETTDGIQLVDTAEFPAQWKSVALATRDFLNVLRDERELNWTFLSPSAVIEPGARTGQFRLGKDRWLVNDKGESRISTQDYAAALINELETPTHINTRFTVGY
jgi:uncharacterized protein